MKNIFLIVNLFFVIVLTSNIYSQELEQVQSSDSIYVESQIQTQEIKEMESPTQETTKGKAKIIDDRKNISSKKGNVTLGGGLGLPYGGIGGRLGVNILDNLNLFGGIGTQFAGLGYNVGLLKDFKSKTLTQFYLTGMYGTNAGILISGTSDFDELFTGLSFGLGLKLNSRRSNGNYWDIGVLVPIRSDDYKEAEEAIKNNPLIIDFKPAWPFGIIVGYNIKL